MVDIFEEVDEELRQDKYQEALKKWGPWVRGIALAIIVSVAGWQWFAHARVQAAEAASETYLAAVDQIIAEQPELAAAGLDEVILDGHSGYRTLALLQRANMALEAGDNDGAAAYFDEAASSTSEPILRDIAQLKAVWARWDSLSFADIEIRLSPLTGDTAPYRFLARESIGAAALREGDLDRAESEYQVFAFNFEISDEMRRRAQEALASIAARRAVETPAETPVETPAETPADTPVSEDEQAIIEDGSND